HPSAAMVRLRLPAWMRVLRAGGRVLEDERRGLPGGAGAGRRGRAAARLARDGRRPRRGARGPPVPLGPGVWGVTLSPNLLAFFVGGQANLRSEGARWEGASAAGAAPGRGGRVRRLPGGPVRVQYRQRVAARRLGRLARDDVPGLDRAA